MKSNSRLRPRGSISPRALHPACSSQCTVCHLVIPSVGRSVLRSARRSHWRWFTGFSHRCKTRSPRPNAPPRDRALDLGPRPVRRGGCPHVDFALVPGSTAPPREVGRSPLPTRPADPTGSTATSLATAIGATAGDNHVRRPSASWWQLEGAHCLLLAPDLRCVACRVVCMSACPWPRPPPSDPTATPRQPNRTYRLWEAVGAVGGGSWPF